MRTWGVAEARREVLRKLTAQGFIDDARCGAFVRDKIRLAGGAPARSARPLRAKGVADAAIDAALAETDDPEGRGARLRTRLERKLRTVCRRPLRPQKTSCSAMRCRSATTTPRVPRRSRS